MRDASDLDSRTWGDGRNRTAEHVIEAISYRLGVVGCGCGATMHTTLGSAALKQLWDIHRGNSEAPIEAFIADDLATDEEVEEFFRLHLDKRGLTPGVVLRQAQPIESEVQYE